VERRRFRSTRDFFIQLIDGVILPAVGLGRPRA
jgi:hypothetical protein